MTSVRPSEAGRGGWPRAIAITACAGLAAAVAGLLIAGVPDVYEVPLAPRTAAPQPLRLEMAGRAQGVIQRETRFEVTDAAALASQTELRFVLGTYDARPTIINASLTIDGTSCTFSTTPGTIRQNTPRSFRRDSECSGPAGPATATFRAELRASTQRQGQLALWVVRAAPADVGPEHVLRLAGEEAVTPAGSRVRARSERTTARVGLVAFMWNRPAWHVWMLLGVSWLSLGAGASCLTGRAPGASLSALGTGAVALGLALTYVVIVPPFQAPDEPDHLLGFARLTNRPTLEIDAAEWAKRLHFDRITSRPSERFLPAHTQQPWPAPWDPTYIHAEDVERRAYTAVRYWRLLSPLVPGSAPAALLSLRLAHAFVFALAFALAVLLLARGTPLPGPALAMLPLLWIPTAPFFGMHHAELTWTLGAFVVLAAAVIAFMASAGPSAGIALGAVTAVILAGPRSAWPIAPLLGMLLAGRILIAPATTARASTRFWIAWGLPILALFGTGLLRVPSPDFDQWHVAGVTPPAEISNLTVVACAAAVVLLGFAAEHMRVKVTPFVSRWASAAAMLLPALAALLATAIALVAAGSLIFAMPELPLVEQARPTIPAYVRQVLAVVATIPRLTTPDHLLWTSFLGGFGWIDTLLPTGLLILVTALFSAGAVWLLGWIAWRRDTTRAAWLLIVASGLAASVAAYAGAAAAMNRNLHGRYLIGAYLVALAVAASAPALTASAGRTPARTSLLLAGAMAVHAISLWVVLGRYVG